MKGTVHIINPEREETVPQNQIPLQANQINITNNPVGNNTYIERYPQMKFVQDPKYRIHANFRPEVTEITTRLAEAVREAVWDCQRSSTYTQEAFESNMKKHLESVPKVTVVSYGMIQKIDQFGNPWVDWMEGKEPYELLQQSLLKIPLKQGTANVQYVPLETEEETEEQEEEKPLWERAWDSIKETASDVWDTVTSKEFREKALAIGGTILVATAASAAVLVTAGAAGAAMGAVVTYLGGSAALAGAVTTATTVGGWTIVGGLAVDAVNTSVEVATGTNYIAKRAYELFGNENWTEEDFLNLYGEGKELLYMGAHGYSTFGANAMAAGYSSQKSVEGSEVKKPYTTSRPSYGKGQVNQVWRNAKDPITGKVYDPTGVEITWDTTKPRNGQWDMGHIPGEKYSEMHQLYINDVISKEEFLEWYRNPNNYRPELPSTNRSHKYE